MMLRTLGWLCVVVGVAGVARGLEPQELAALLAAGEKITVIDVRSTALYQRGHLPQAINIPAALCPDRQLPPLGRVVVYDEGLGQTNAAFALEALNRKPGIRAEILRGGYAGWETTQRTVAAPRGAAREELPVITYQGLEQTTDRDVVLVDLRTAPSTAPARGLAAPAQPETPLTDLKAVFPRFPVTQSPLSLAQRAKAEKSTPPLLVLIDRNDGKAQETARLLRAAGMTRFVILAGGEEALARRGEPGLQRAGSGLLTAPAPVVTPPTPPAP
ncbi:MAG: rhodanese-like domain-containing protein [Verrucomicrobiae bacterium]|nr:rhodanese-like domain-containing protein [Verrucomicrobiae bacterium]